MNAIGVLLTSRGTPMLLMGDELGRSQHGNNNAYCIDSEVSWVDWSLLESNRKLFEFTQSLIKFRHQHKCLRINRFDHEGSSYLPSCSFHGTKPWEVNWSAGSKQLGWLMSCDDEATGHMDAVFVASNVAHYACWFDLPRLPDEYQWQLCYNTGDRDSPSQANPTQYHENGILVGERSMTIFAASPRET